MNLFAIIFALLCSEGTCLAQADFSFYISDETKNENVHYEFSQSITIYDFDFQDPRLIYSKGYEIFGINQEEFTATSESYAGDLSRKDFTDIMEKIHKLPIEALEKHTDDVGRSSGMVTLDGKYHSVFARADQTSRKKWQACLDEMLKKYAPVEKREITHRTIVGDKVKAIAIDFQTLLADPKKYDGKRIRLTGYYHGEFECSSFAATKKDISDYKHALWLGGPSSFANYDKIRESNDMMINVEGTLNLNFHGHMGLWMGELTRLTELLPLNPEQPGADKPDTKPADKEPAKTEPYTPTPKDAPEQK